MELKIFLLSYNSNDLEGTGDDWLKVEKAWRLLSTRKLLLIKKCIHSLFPLIILTSRNIRHGFFNFLNSLYACNLELESTSHSSFATTYLKQKGKFSPVKSKKEIDGSFRNESNENTKQMLLYESET